MTTSNSTVRSPYPAGDCRIASACTSVVMYTLGVGCLSKGPRALRLAEASGEGSSDGGQGLNRLARLMVLALALLCLFTIGAGAEVAHLMPPRLALFQMPSISGTSRAAAVKALRSVSDPSDPSHRAGAERPPTAASVTGELSPLIDTGRLGQQVGALVVNYSTGHVLYALNPDTGFTPASTTKVATAVAAIHTLGPEARFTTAVRLAADGRGLVLVGG